MQRSPEEMADAASWPVCEADLHARHLALVRWRKERNLERLMGDPEWHDPLMAGWWAWGQSCWIGSGWCSGDGPWHVGADGRITKGKAGVGVNKKLPDISNGGRGVNHPQTRKAGVGVDKQLPHISSGGMGVNRPQTRKAGVGEYHPMTMPELLRWFRFLSARLRHVRVLNGDWSRACTHGALFTLSVRTGGSAGVFLDPPYSGNERCDGLYAVDDASVAEDVNKWCVAHGQDKKLRIVLAGFDSEHGNLADHGWRQIEWYRKGFLRGGMANTGSTGGQQSRERLWLSPACKTESAQLALLDLLD